MSSSSSSMKAYLAAKYMSGPKAEAILARTTDATTKKKKRKPKAETTDSPSFIKDEDDDLRWGKPLKNEEDEDMQQAVVEKDRSFKKRRVEQDAEGAGWITVRASEKETDEVIETIEDAVRPVAGGLIMPSEFQSSLPQAKWKGKSKEEPTAQEQETVYRDASGRRIDTAEEERERMSQKAAEAKKEAAKLEWGKGLVQREEAEARKREEERERSKGFARRADDADLNERQKAEERWNDPAAAFLTKKEKKGPRRPVYHGPPPPPNRFGILPGHRWDGVDRGNGFEKKYFQKLNERGRTKLEAYEWSVDDM